ncbi:MAG: gluconokinase [Desulforhopalus sp.]
MILVLIGPMGCGKTTIGKTLSQQCGWRFEDGDDYHPQANKDKMQFGVPLDDDDRAPWLAILHDLLMKAHANGENVVLACSALKRKYRRLLGIDQQKIHSVYLKGSKELLAKRIEGRHHEYMNKSLIDSQLNTLEEPRAGIVVSIEGTPEEITARIIEQLNDKQEKNETANRCGRTCGHG